MYTKKLNPIISKELRSILAKLEIFKGQLTLDLDKDTILLPDEDPYEAIFSSIGVLTPERAKEMKEEVRRMREDWD